MYRARRIPTRLNAGFRVKTEAVFPPADLLTSASETTTGSSSRQQQQADSSSKQTAAASKQQQQADSSSKQQQQADSSSKQTAAASSQQQQASSGHGDFVDAALARRHGHVPDYPSGSTIDPQQAGTAAHEREHDTAQASNSSCSKRKPPSREEPARAKKNNE